MNIRWSPADKDFIKENAATMKDKDLAVELAARSGKPVSLGAVRKLRQRLGCIKKSGRGVCELRGEEVRPSEDVKPEGDANEPWERYAENRKQQKDRDFGHNG